MRTSDGEGMKKKDREIYITLAGEIDWDLCGFCRYSRCDGSACCESSYCECEHPLEVITDNAESGCICPGDDCWGFKPAVNVRDCADIVGLILANDWDPERVSWRKEDGQIKVSGLAREKSMVLSL
jgi:hypothetical protein